MSVHPDPACKLSENLYDICHCCVYRQRNCPKQVEFYSKNKFEKLVHLVGFIIRIYHDHGHLNVKSSNISYKISFTQLVTEF